jgi:glycosyltransferase involved in cell wall biosynthesis
MPIHLSATGFASGPTEWVRMLLILSGVGLLGLSILWPLVAWTEYLFHFKNPKRDPFQPTLPSRIDILIPAHNESDTLGLTLASIESSIRHLYDHLLPDQAPTCLIRVGADSCSDRTADVARQYSHVQVSEFPDNKSKWLTLKKLCMESSGDWFILVDAGTIWPDSLLLTLIDRMRENPDALALCPAYKPLQASWLYGFIWQIEALLKRAEVLCGGPISVHGATVCYKAAPLKKAFEELGNTLWLNDDVAIPLVLRALYPDGLILYPVGEVLDDGLRKDPPGFKRRARILIGNLQWAGSLLPYCFRRNPVAGTIALRRLFRVLWAYWALFPILALSIALPHGLAILICLSLSLVLFRSCREVAAAAMVSLWTPIRLLTPHRYLHGVWK